MRRRGGGLDKFRRMLSQSRVYADTLWIQNRWKTYSDQCRAKHTINNRRQERSIDSYVLQVCKKIMRNGAARYRWYGTVPSNQHTIPIILLNRADTTSVHHLTYGVSIQYLKGGFISQFKTFWAKFRVHPAFLDSVLEGVSQGKPRHKISSTTVNDLDFSSLLFSNWPSKPWATQYFVFRRRCWLSPHSGIRRNWDWGSSYSINLKPGYFGPSTWFTLWQRMYWCRDSCGRRRRPAIWRPSSDVWCRGI